MGQKLTRNRLNAIEVFKRHFGIGTVCLETANEFIADNNFSGLACWINSTFIESSLTNSITDALWEG